MCGVYISTPMVSAGRFLSFGSALRFPPFIIMSSSVARGCSAVQIHTVQVQHSADKCKYNMVQGTPHSVVQQNKMQYSTPTGSVHQGAAVQGTITLGKVLLATALRLTFCIYEETHLNGSCHGFKCTHACVKNDTG